MSKLCSWTFAVAILFSLAACANPPIVAVGEGVYLLAKEDRGGIFGNMAKLKADVIAEANAFAANRGMVAVPVSFKEKPVSARPADWAAVEYQFRLAPSGTAEARTGSLNADRSAIPTRPDIAIQRSTHVNADLSARVSGNGPPSASPSRDLYTELIRLDDLKKRGIISSAEFEQQKRKLLNAQ